MAQLWQKDLTDLNQALEARTPQELLAWAKELFGTRVGILSAMQEAGCVICHMASSARLPMDVVFVDTGVHFQETLDTRDRIIQEYGLRVRTLRPEATMEQQTAKYGILYLSHEGQERCCDMRKTQPLLAVRDDFDALIGSLRRDEGARRGNVPILALDPPMNCIRVNVLAKFTNDQMRDYIEQHKVVLNPLHSQGYTTIGCNRCTTPVLPEEPKRAGRWRHLGPWAQYCGINPSDTGGGMNEAVDLPEDLIDRILGRRVDFAI